MVATFGTILHLIEYYYFLQCSKYIPHALFVEAARERQPGDAVLYRKTALRSMMFVFAVILLAPYILAYYYRDSVKSLFEQKPHEGLVVGAVLSYFFWGFFQAWFVSQRLQISGRATETHGSLVRFVFQRKRFSAKTRLYTEEQLKERYLAAYMINIKFFSIASTALFIGMMGFIFFMLR